VVDAVVEVVLLPRSVLEIDVVVGIGEELSEEVFHDAEEESDESQAVLVVVVVDGGDSNEADPKARSASTKYVDCMAFETHSKDCESRA